MTLNLRHRAQLYAEAFPQYPDSHLHASDRWLQGVWMLGNNYRATSRLYGAYPPSYLLRVESIFPECREKLHLFSGSLPPGDYVRIDINPDCAPEYVLDVAAPNLFGKTRPLQFDIIFADPPYSGEDAKRYGFPMPDRRKVLQNCHALLRPSGFLVWLDTMLPMYRKTDFLHFGAICLIRSTNHRVRLCSLFQKQP